MPYGKKGASCTPDVCGDSGEFCWEWEKAREGVLGRVGRLAKVQRQRVTLAGALQAAENSTRNGAIPHGHGRLEMYIKWVSLLVLFFTQQTRLLTCFYFSVGRHLGDKDNNLP